MWLRKNVLPIRSYSRWYRKLLSYSLSKRLVLVSARYMKKRTKIAQFQTAVFPDPAAGTDIPFSIKNGEQSY